MKKKHEFIENFLSRQGYGCIMAGDQDPNPWITYFPPDSRKGKEKARYTYYYKEKMYYDQTNDIKYTPAQFVRYIKRLENLISFW